MEKKKIILPSKKYFKAPETDLDIRINLDKSENLLREGDTNIVLDLTTLYDQERNESKNYKIHGKLKMIFRNMYSGTTDYTPLKRNLYLTSDGSDGNFSGFTPYNEFAILRNDVLRELNHPTSGSVLGTFTPNITLTGYTGHTTVTPISAPYQNWNLYLSYVHDKDSSYPMSYTLSGNTTFSFTAQDGIPFRITTGNTYYTLTSPIEHGIKANEYIILSGGTLNMSSVSGRTYYVESVGDETYNSEKYVINILKNQFISGTTLGNIVLGKRCIDRNDITGTTSEYYVHKHKTLTNVSEYIMDKVGFESPIWENERKLLFENSEGTNDFLVERNRMESVLFDFKKPFILSGITNNLGYTPTEVYISMILRNGNGYFNYPPKVGYKFNFHDTWIDNHFSGTTSNESSLSGSTFTSNTTVDIFTGGTELNVGTILTGGFVEYNNSEMKENILSESYYKFTHRKDIFDHKQDNTLFYNGCSINNMVGYYYQPHYRIKLRELSPYIESSNTKEVYNLPENTKYFEKDGLWKWKDLYDHGYVDVDGNGTTFPFINNMHYVKTDINFYLRNEMKYTNKTDGLIKFKDKKINC